MQACVSLGATSDKRVDDRTGMHRCGETRCGEDDLELIADADDSGAADCRS